MEANHWKVTMQDVTMEEVTLAGLSLQTKDESGRGIVQLRNVSMSNMLGVGVVLEQTIARISGMTCRECNVGIVARGSSLKHEWCRPCGQAQAKQRDRAEFSTSRSE